MDSNVNVEGNGADSDAIVQRVLDAAMAPVMRQARAAFDPQSLRHLLPDLSGDGMMVAYLLEITIDTPIREEPAT